MRVPRRVFLLAAAASVLLSLPTLLVAAGPTFWTVATTSELLKGTSNGVLIDRTGTLSAGPQLTNRLSSTSAQIWSLAAAPDGTLWAGTGGDGRVIRIRPGRAEETIFDAEEPNVFAVAVAGTRVYAATGPDGKVYAIDGDGPARVFFDPSEKYIWALAVDQENRLWIGAGNPAVVYRVNSDGSSHVVYHPPAAHVVSLARDARGRMLAGTESPGRLYRFETGDRPFVLLDTGPSELHAIVSAPDGSTYAAALNRGDEGHGGGGGEVTSVAAAISQTPTSGAPATSSSSASEHQQSTIFRIDPNGSWETFWETSDLIYDVALQRDGSLLVASGPEGRLYTVQPGRQVSLYTGVDAEQITRLVVPANADTAVMATANPGRVIALGPATQSPATYISPVRDTKSASRWGTVRWEATGAVSLFTRSGNTEIPDETWSDWSGPYAKHAGETIQSPTARFLQWKAVLTTAAGQPPPRLTSVTAAYLGRNARPAVTSITVQPPGVVFQRPFSSDDTAIAGLDEAVADARRPPGAETATSPTSTGRRMFQKGLQTISWKSEDADGDHLAYTLSYRREGESTWHDLKSGLSDPIYVWDTTTVSDGRYIVRVVASDEPSNTPDRTLTGSRESEPIDIDNTPPVMTTEISRAGNSARLIVQVHDAYSPIQKLEYSLRGESWELIYPVDGLADSPDERYEIPLANESDAAGLVLRATDAMQNVASRRATQ